MVFGKLISSYILPATLGNNWPQVISGSASRFPSLKLNSINWCLWSDFDDVLGVEEFYEEIYNLTPAHKDDIHSAISENPDLEVITPSGGERRKANTISIGDVIKLKNQLSLFPMFPNQKK